MTKRVTDRRGFLGFAGALVVTFTIARPVRGAAEPPSEKSVSPDEVQGFLMFDPSGDVSVFAGKVDLGTGVQTALMQIVAEELDVPMRRIRYTQGDTALTPDQGTTSGSLSIERGGMQLRHAAATARQVLLARAANVLRVDQSHLTIQNGVVRTSDAREAALGDLVKDAPITLAIDPKAPTKPPSDYRIIGKSVPRVDIPDKVAARFTYMQDFRVPGMLHGRVIRPPATGADLLQVDESSLHGIPGIVRVVRIGNFLGVVARTEWAAIRAAQTLVVKWSDAATLPDQTELWSVIRATPVTREDVTSAVGDVEQALRAAKTTREATFDFAIQTHGSIGPSCSVARFDGDRVTCWTASQSVHTLRYQLAATLGIPATNVRCVYVAGAGCYGRNGHEDAAADAVLLARAAGQPVRVQWMRADEHGWDPKGPPVLIDMRGGLDADGNVGAWSGAFFYPRGGGGNVALVASDLAGLPSDSDLNPGNVINDTAIPYHFPNVRTVAHRLASTPLKPSWIRTPGRMQNTFANEAFLDELAHAAGIDPLDMRLRHIDDPRGQAVLEAITRLTGWRDRARPVHGDGVVTGRGLSYVKYELYRTYVAAVADVEVNGETGELRVRRCFVVQDCGQIINPDGVRNQIEGNVIQTVSRVLLEQVTFDRKMVTTLDWASYPILTFPDVPDVVIELIDRPETPPWGAGEASAAVIPAAIANAVFDATGKRLRSVPFTADKVKIALRA
jgi:CO/xanthine dehydrogenase Mo-binding subunit